MATNLRFNNPEIRRLEQQAVTGMIHRVADDIADDMRRLVPVDTGALRSTIKAIHQVRLKSRIWIGTDYWAHVEYGTRAHRITSHGNYPLRNRFGRVLGRSVWHPGTRAQPFIRPSVYRLRAVS